MSDEIAIKIEGLGKRYQLGQTVDLQRNVRETLMTLPRFFGRKAATAGRMLAQRLERRAKLTHLADEPGDQKPDPDTPRGTFWALRDINLEVKKGEAIGIIGRNGAGKSTLLKILSRVTAPTRGRAEMHGRVGSLLEVGTGFNPELTGRENTYLNGSILGMSRREVNQKFDEIVEFSGVRKFIDTPVKRYSSGMRVRLGFAVAAHLDPEILIIDEVLAVGDFEFRKKCINKMKSSYQTGQTILFVSHNMAAIRQLCSNTMLLKEGRLIDYGPSAKVIADYLSAEHSHEGERLWPDQAVAPGNDIVKLRKISAFRDNAQPSDRFCVHESFNIEVEFQVYREKYPLRAGLYFYDDADNLLFATFDNLDSPWSNRPRPDGIYCERCTIPKDLLNEGAISVSVNISSNPGGLHVSFEEALHLEIKDSYDSSGVRGDIAVPWPNALVRPRLRWSATLR